MRTLVEQRRAILICLIGTFTIVAIATLTVAPSYEAVASIAVGSVEADGTGIKASAKASQAHVDPGEVNADLGLLQSELLALQVIHDLRLDRQPEFGGQGSHGSLGGTSQESWQPYGTDVTRVLPLFKAGLRVVFLPEPSIIEIRYRNRSPKLATRIANALANTYVEQSFPGNCPILAEGGELLSNQLVELQMKIETSQEELVRYEKEHDIASYGQMQNEILQRLKDLNEKLTDAKSDRMKKESVYRLVQSDGRSSVAEAVGADQQEALLAPGRPGADLNLRSSLPHARAAQLGAGLKNVDIQIRGGTAAVASQVHKQYIAALQREMTLQEALNQPKEVADGLAEQAMEYSRLKRAVETSRRMYEALLEKLRSAALTAGRLCNHSALVKPAHVPTFPSGRNLARNLALASALGLTSGATLAFLKEKPRRTRERPTTG